jgi:polysaccharide export outer membrane protein
LFAVVVTGCSGQVPRQLAGQPITNEVAEGGIGDPTRYPTPPDDLETVPVTIGPPRDPALADLVYRIGPYDSLRIDIFGVEELSSSGQVNFQGMYTMPLIGPIVLNGMTTQEAEAEIERILGSRYIRDPNVTVYVVETANMNVVLSGKMNGTLKITGRTTLGQVLSAAGGVPPVGKKRQVVIFRASESTRRDARPELHAYVVDYQAILEGKLRDPLLVGNDRIYVPPSALALFFDPWLGVFRTYVPIQTEDLVVF